MTELELVPSEAARAAVRQLVSSSDSEGGGDEVPAWLRGWLERPGAPLGLDQVRWLRRRLRERGDPAPLGTLMQAGEMRLPGLVSPPRNPELEARCQRLRAEQANREYREMVRNVDTVRLREPTLDIGKQLREVNAQLLEVGQVLFSVAAAFLFGYVAMSVAGQADTARRILAGLAAAAIVLIAEGYFLIRYLSAADEGGATAHRAPPDQRRAPATLAGGEPGGRAEVVSAVEKKQQ